MVASGFSSRRRKDDDDDIEEVEVYNKGDVYYYEDNDYDDEEEDSCGDNTNTESDGVYSDHDDLKVDQIDNELSKGIEKLTLSNSNQSHGTEQSNAINVNSKSDKSIALKYESQQQRTGQQQFRMIKGQEKSTSHDFELISRENSNVNQDFNHEENNNESKFSNRNQRRKLRAERHHKKQPLDQNGFDNQQKNKGRRTSNKVRYQKVNRDSEKPSSPTKDSIQKNKPKILRYRLKNSNPTQNNQEKTLNQNDTIENQSNFANQIEGSVDSLSERHLNTNLAIDKLGPQPEEYTNQRKEKNYMRIKNKKDIRKSDERQKQERRQERKQRINYENVPRAHRQYGSDQQFSNTEPVGTHTKQIEFQHVSKSQTNSFRPLVKHDKVDFGSKNVENKTETSPFNASTHHLNYTNSQTAREQFIAESYEHQNIRQNSKKQPYNKKFNQQNFVGPRYSSKTNKNSYRPKDYYFDDQIEGEDFEEQQEHNTFPFSQHQEFRHPYGTSLQPMVPIPVRPQYEHDSMQHQYMQGTIQPNLNQMSYPNSSVPIYPISPFMSPHEIGFPRTFSTPNPNPYMYGMEGSQFTQRSGGVYYIPTSSQRQNGFEYMNPYPEDDGIYYSQPDANLWQQNDLNYSGNYNYYAPQELIEEKTSNQSYLKKLNVSATSFVPMSSQSPSILPRIPNTQTEANSESVIRHQKIPNSTT